MQQLFYFRFSRFHVAFSFCLSFQVLLVHTSGQELMAEASTLLRDSLGNRKFYDFEFIDENLHLLLNATNVEPKEDSSQLFQYIRENIIGANYTFISPYGLRKGNRIRASFHFFHCCGTIAQWQWQLLLALLGCFWCSRWHSCTSSRYRGYSYLYCSSRRQAQLYDNYSSSSTQQAAYILYVPTGSGTGSGKLTQNLRKKLTKACAYLSNPLLYSLKCLYYNLVTQHIFYTLFDC